MQKLRTTRLACVAVMAAAFATCGFVGSASAHTGEFAKFNFCPSTNPSVFKCLHAVTTGGKIVLGKKTVPIVKPVTLQGGTSEATEETEFVSDFFGATNGVTLSKAPQPVPGGLSGIINCKEISLGWLRASCEAVFENGVTGLNATLELARPANEIKASEVNLLFAEGTTLHIPLKVHLENPFLGSSCYIGSSSSPIIWNVTSGTTSPPGPNKPITGKVGKLEFREEFQILHASGTELVDNAWSAPKASGCGGFLVELILNPIINGQVGLPAAAGLNTAQLQEELDIATAEAVNAH